MRVKKLATLKDSKSLKYIVNNGFRVPLQMFILALLPIPYLYLINLVVTIIMPGILLGFLLSFDLHKGLIGCIAFIPHYTFEIMGLLYFNKCAVYAKQSHHTSLYQSL